MTNLRLPLELYVDGASRGNPGKASIGVYALCDGKVAFTLSEVIGETTNNVAEYQALIRGLEEAVARGFRSVTVYADSQLTVRQVEGIYRVRTPHLLPLLEKVQALRAQFQVFTIASVPRAQNRAADRLANLALDRPS